MSGRLYQCLEIKVLTFSLAGLEVVSSSAFISYVLQVQVLLRSCQTNLISSCYFLPFPLLHYLAQTEPFQRQYTTRWNGSSQRIRMDKSTVNGQKGAKTPNQDLFSEDIWFKVEVNMCNFMKSSSVIFMFSCLVSECQLLFFYLLKKYFFLTRELSLINTCCWRADHEILMHDGGAGVH